MNTPLIERFSSWNRYVRVCCRIWHWYDSTLGKNRVKSKTHIKVSGAAILPYSIKKLQYKPLLKKAIKKVSSEEFISMEARLIALEQRRHFEEEIKQLEKKNGVNVNSKIYKFNPILENGILRVSARLKDSLELGQETKCPILLPKRAHITKLILLQYHQEECQHYGGPQQQPPGYRRIGID